MVEDRTGLKGRYSTRPQFKLGPWARAVRSPNPDRTSKELIEAVRDQWGTRIEKGKGVLHVVGDGARGDAAGGDTRARRDGFFQVSHGAWTDNRASLPFTEVA
jgi:hypothetical protein